MKYHDTHFHLDLMVNPEEVARQIEQQQIYTIAVTNSPSVFFYTEKIAANTKYIRAALGLHPELAAERYREVEQFIQLIDRTRYIGEIGLDNSNKTIEDYRKQKKVFEKVISTCADYGDKILTIHSRRAAKDILDIIGDNFPGKIILHWYSDSLKFMETAIDRGYYFSVNHKMLRSITGKKIMSSIPINQILLESDAPFTTRKNTYSSQVIMDTLGAISRDASRSDLTTEAIKRKILSNFNNLISR